MQFLDLEPDADGAEGAADAVDPLEKFDADFALMTGELVQLLAEILEALGGEVQIAAAA